MSADVRVALAGQPNAGKSTIFNMLTGARQFVANYPGVTVEKKTGNFALDGKKGELVDLPGTYSLTSYSLEERVARNYILNDHPDVIINVVDASNLKRHLQLTLQLIEMEVPVVVALNMTDVAEGRGMELDVPELERRLGVPVVSTVAKKNTGKKALLEAVNAALTIQDERCGALTDYADLNPGIEKLADILPESNGYPRSWLALKLMEGDAEALKHVQASWPDSADHILEKASTLRQEFESEADEVDKYVAFRRHRKAMDVVGGAVKLAEQKITLSDRVDAVVLNRFLGPVILLGVIYVMYYLSIVQGYKLTEYTWPLLAGFRTFIASLLPSAGLVGEPLLRSFVLWFIDSINAMLNYIPIFFILFCLIAIIEDSGYMSRMAFILDRALRRFGLHGQSTLPLILGGVFVGGCAIPGVMACKAVPDEKSRLATIMIVPMMNCLAKVPLYMLLINTYFVDHKAPAMFFIATITLFMALPTAKGLTLTVLKNKEQAPFVMEMPAYHVPTASGVLKRAVERLWLFIRKIITVVAAVAVVIFVLLYFPDLSEQRMDHYRSEMAAATEVFNAKMQHNAYYHAVEGDGLTEAIIYWEDYKTAKLSGKNKAQLKGRFEARNPDFYKIVTRADKDAKKMNRALKKVFRARQQVAADMKKERIDRSVLGRIGHGLEPATRYAGFNWRINVAMLSSFAAKESSVATLGAIYQQDAEAGQTLEEGMRKTESGFTALHALAVMLFMALFPPCIPAAIAVKLQSGSAKWMCLSIALPTVLGLCVAILVFSGGSLLGLSGWQAMWIFYALAIALTIGMALINPEKNNSKGEIYE